MRKGLLTAAAVLAIAGAATAQETINFLTLNGGLPISSGGNVGAGTGSTRSTPGIPTFAYTFANSFLWDGTVTINGTLREVNTGTFASEARIIAASPFNGTSTGVDIQPFTSFGFTGTVTATNVVRSPTGFTGVPFNPLGQLWNFSFYESFNDAGEDAEWDALSITFNQFVAPPLPPSTSVGTVGASTSVVANLGAGQIAWYEFNYDPTGQDGSLDINTIGSTFDTEIGLYDSNGILIGSNDDASGLGLLSRLSFAPGALAAGTYYVALGAFNTTYVGAFGASSTSLLTGEYRLNIVPTPGALALLGLGGLMAGRRRRA